MTSAASSSRCSAALRDCGRWLRARSSPSGCAASACSRISLQTIRRQRPRHGVPQAIGGAWLGRRPQPADRLSLGQRDTIAYASTQRNWWRSRRTSSSRMRPRPARRCNKRPASCRSCSSIRPIRSALALSRAWRGRAAMSPASPCSNLAWAGNGWSCSKRLRRASGASLSYAIRPAPPAPASWRDPVRGAVLWGGAGPLDVRDAGEIERALAAFARTSNGGLIVTGPGSAFPSRTRSLRSPPGIGLPAVYSFRRLRRARRPDLLRTRCNRPVPARGRLCRSHP